MLLVLEEDCLVTAVSDECDGCNAETGEHCSKVGALGKDGVLSPSFTSCPGIVVDGYFLLCFSVAASGKHCALTCGVVGWVEEARAGVKLCVSMSGLASSVTAHLGVLLSAPVRCCNIQYSLLQLQIYESTLNSIV